MDKRQIGLAVGIALLCVVLWFFAGGSEQGGQLGDVAALGLIAVAVIVVLKLLAKRRD